MALIDYSYDGYLEEVTEDVLARVIVLAEWGATPDLCERAVGLRPGVLEDLLERDDKTRCLFYQARANVGLMALKALHDGINGFKMSATGVEAVYRIIEATKSMDTEFGQVQINFGPLPEASDE